MCTATGSRPGRRTRRRPAPTRACRSGRPGSWGRRRPRTQTAPARAWRRSGPGVDVRLKGGEAPRGGDRLAGVRIEPEKTVPGTNFQVAAYGIWAASAWARARVAPGPFTRSQLTRERCETTVTRIGLSRWQPQLAPRTKKPARPADVAGWTTDPGP